MKIKVLLLVFFVCQLTFSQRGGAKIAYIDTEYILKNVPEYQEATAQLEAKVLKWKNEIEAKLSQIEQKRNALNNEKALLTKELYEERLEDLSFEEKEIIDYQQKRFGPNGDLMIQRKQLMQPVQDQIFLAVQDLAETRNYDFVFDKSADVVMLYSAERYDVSDRIISVITRTAKRKQAKTRKEKREAEKEEVIEDELSDSQLERQKLLEQKKAKRDSSLAARRAQLKAEREAKMEERRLEREKRLKEREGVTEDNDESNKEVPEESDEAPKEKTRAELLEEKRQARIADRERRAKALEEKRKRIEEERRKQREAREAERNQE